MNQLSVSRTAVLLWGLTSFWLIHGAFLGCSRRTERVGRPYDELSFEIGEASLTVEVASDDYSRKLGLMNRERESLPESRGMIFMFPVVTEQGFWMKNTLIPLSIAFISDEGEILQIEHMKPKDLSSTKSKHKVRYALEVNKGWFERHGIKAANGAIPGDRIKDFGEKVGIYRAF